MKFLQRIRKWLAPLKELWEKDAPPHFEEAREDIAGALGRPISPWARRRGKRGRSNHPWARRDGQRKKIIAPSAWKGVFYE